MQEFSIHNTTRKGTIPNVPFLNIKNAILGKSYELSLVLCADTKAHRLNKTYRNKTYKPNVLAFPVSKHSGEVFINIRKTEREARRFGHTFKKHLCFLFIHSLLHLKGMKHGSTMESTEKKVLKQFGF